MNNRKNIEVEDLKGEIWVDIPNYEGLYQVSSLGRIKRLPSIVRYYTKHGFYEKLDEGGLMSFHKGNYYRVGLSKNGKTITYLVHRLVAEAFIEKPHEDYEVDHINEDVYDNRLENLRWISGFENKSRSNKGKYRRRNAHLSNNPKAKYVIGYRSGVEVEKYSCAKELSMAQGIKYSTLKRQLQENRCNIEGIIYRYGDFVNKKV
jgi:hypothetical protein